MIIWKPVKGFEDLYEVSNEGDIRSIASGKALKHNVNKANASIVSLYRNGKQSNKTVSRVVAEAFVPNPNSFKCARHKDGNPQNNKASNLYWSNNKGHHWVAVIDLDTGKCYESMSSCARALEVPKCSVFRCVYTDKRYKGLRISVKNPEDRKYLTGKTYA